MNIPECGNADCNNKAKYKVKDTRCHYKDCGIYHFCKNCFLKSGKKHKYNIMHMYATDKIETSIQELRGW